VEELSSLLVNSSEEGPAGDTLSARWALWCDQIEGASARAALTLLEAQLFAWHVETGDVRASGGGHRDGDVPTVDSATAERGDEHGANDEQGANDEHGANDEAAPTEVDAA
jgi:hypothetical protein